MPAFVNSTNFDHARCLDASCPAPKLFTDERRASFDLEDEDDDKIALEKKRECASRVAAWINQSAVTLHAYTLPSPSPSSSSSSSTTSASDVLDFDLDIDSDFDLDLEDAEPHVLYSTPAAKSAPVIHAPVLRRPSSHSSHSSHSLAHGRSSRSRSRGRHHGYKPRMPFPLGLYVIQEEEAE
ncbi:hypothetical protein C8R45DRAFT_1025668 [Mycena sanguinolenta]|nr:hypothetical protein C8R45DRAFT_1025668 [Mycena sanguinolenta]